MHESARLQLRLQRRGVGGRGDPRAPAPAPVAALVGRHQLHDHRRRDPHPAADPRAGPGPARAGGAAPRGGGGVSRARNLVLLLIVLVCVASLWFAWRDGPATPDPPASPPGDAATAAPDRPVAPDETITLAVLNGSGEPGLARRVSRLLPAAGVVVVAVGNAPHDTFSRTLLVDRRLDPARRRQLVHLLADPAVVREWDRRCEEEAVLVLGRDHGRIVTALERLR
ncbi:hypothetical protein GF314_11265 [bacterium]|nr:hypothetical protein [bacterium]